MIPWHLLPSPWQRDLGIKITAHIPRTAEWQVLPCEPVKISTAGIKPPTKLGSFTPLRNTWAQVVLSCHSRIHLRTAPIWLSRLLSGSADLPQNPVWLIYCSGWCSAPHSAQPRQSELPHTTAKHTDSAFSFHKLTALQLFSTLFPPQNYSVNITRDNSPNPGLPLHPVKIKPLCNSSVASIALKKTHKKPTNLFSRIGVFH